MLSTTSAHLDRNPRIADAVERTCFKRPAAKGWDIFTALRSGRDDTLVDRRGRGNFF